MVEAAAQLPRIGIEVWLLSETLEVGANQRFIGPEGVGDRWSWLCSVAPFLNVVRLLIKRRRLHHHWLRHQLQLLNRLSHALKRTAQILLEPLHAASNGIGLANEASCNLLFKLQLALVEAVDVLLQYSAALLQLGQGEVD